MKALKTTLKRTLTKEEIQEAHDTFKKAWEKSGSHGVHNDLYQEWRRDEPGQEPESYKDVFFGHWGGGNHGSSITHDEMFAYWQEKGWPKDERIRDDDGEGGFTPGNQTIRWEEYSNVQCWGYGRRARNVPRSLVDDPDQFHLLEVGLHNFLEARPREEADGGEIALMVEGTSKAGGGNPYTSRLLAIVSGITYNPVCSM
jgi:hypothetical protein